MRAHISVSILLVMLAGCGGGGSGAESSVPSSGGMLSHPSGNAPAATITELQVPVASIGGTQGGLAVAPGGDVYFSVGGSYVGARYSHGTFTGFLYYDQRQESYSVGPVATSSAGAAFFAVNGNAVGSSTPSAAIQSISGTGPGFALFSPSSSSGALAGDAFGNVWGAINACSTGACLEKIVGDNLGSIVTVAAASAPTRINGVAPAGDGSVWIALSSGALQHYSSSATLLSSTALGKGETANGLVVARDGSPWWTDTATNSIGHLLQGTAREYAVPTQNSGLGAITRGGDGALWFTEYAASKIGRIDAMGTIAEYATPTANATPTDIAGPNTGCDPNVIWFVEASTSKLGKIVLQ